MSVLAQIADLDKVDLLKALAGLLEEKERETHKVHSCPSCGFNLKNDRLIIKDGFVLDPRGQLFYNARAVKITQTPLRVLYTIAKEDGRPVTYDAIADRACDAHKTDPRTLIKLYVHGLRKQFKAAGIPFPIKNEPCVGYFWELQKNT